MTSSLTFSIQDMSNLTMLMDFSPKRDYNEDRKTKKTIAMKDLQPILARLTVTISMIRQLEASIERPLFFHKYPRLSRVWMIVMILFVYFFDPRYLLTYVLALVVLLFGYNSPFFQSSTDRFLHEKFFSHQNPYSR